ncbi:MAG: gliding motility-associated C-terminal domain-containing protein, partial [Bacteroidales bacterium]
TVTAEGWYKVTLTTIGGCMATDSVLMLTAFAPLTMPNAFTPNGDILNDVFKAVTTPEKIRSYTLYIYDRWGKQVYFTNDVTQGWDGTIDGAAAPVGTYVYYVKYSNTSGAVREKRGMVVLVK